MTIHDKIRDETLQYGISKKAAKISGFLSGKTNKYEHATDEEILRSHQSKMIEQAKFIYYLLG